MAAVESLMNWAHNIRHFSTGDMSFRDGRIFWLRTSRKIGRNGRIVDKPSFLEMENFLCRGSLRLQPLTMVGGMEVRVGVLKYLSDKRMANLGSID